MIPWPLLSAAPTFIVLNIYESCLVVLFAGFVYKILLFPIYNRGLLVPGIHSSETN